MHFEILIKKQQIFFLTFDVLIITLYKMHCQKSGRAEIKNIKNNAICYISLPPDRGRFSNVNTLLPSLATW